jgi:hypothetical protein
MKKRLDRARPYHYTQRVRFGFGQRSKEMDARGERGGSVVTIEVSRPARGVATRSPHPGNAGPLTFPMLVVAVGSGSLDAYLDLRGRWG